MTTLSNCVDAHTADWPRSARRLSALAFACSLAALTACGGGGSGASGQAQSVDFPYPGVRYVGLSAPLEATASSGLAVVFTSNTPTVCTVEGETLVPVAAGECSITAEQAGGEGFAAAKSQQLFNIIKQEQTIQFSPPDFMRLDDAPLQLSATAASGLPVSFSSETPAVCTVEEGKLRVLAKGACLVIAQQPGDDTYAPAAVPGVIAVDPLIFLTGYMADGSATLENGSINTSAGSNKDGWWCSDPEWCGRTVVNDSGFTFFYRIQPLDPDHPNSDTWISGYWGMNIAAPGGGIQITDETTLKLRLAQNAEWFNSGATAPDARPEDKAQVSVTLVLGHTATKADGNSCNVKLSSVITPPQAEATSYALLLSGFTVSEACELTGLDAMGELAGYPIRTMEFGAAGKGMNTTVSSTSADYPTYGTELTLLGPITFQ